MKKFTSNSVLWIVTVVLLCLPSFSFASGFGIFTQGASSLGQGSAVVAHGESPEAIFYNPALINELPGTQVEIGTTLIFADRDFKSAATGKATETDDDVFFPSTFYITHKFNDFISAGLGFFSPFGLATTWDDDWEGRYLATKSEITTYNINPVISCRISPKISLAAGLDFMFLESSLESRIPSAAFSIPGPSFDINQKFDGSGDGIGYNFGFLFNVNKAFSLGASYRSEVKIDVDGDLKFHDEPSYMPHRISGSTTITLPQQVSAGIAYRPTDRLVMELGMRWEDWSSFDRLKIQIAHQPSVVYPRDWRGTFAVNLGGKYRLNDTFAVTAGYLYGKNPVPDSNFEPAIPDSDTHLFCLGGEAQLGNFTAALAYAYQLQEERTKSTNHYGATANGEYDSDIQLLALSFTYKF